MVATGSRQRRGLSGILLQVRRVRMIGRARSVLLCLHFQELSVT